jgi:hypothetical protein
MPTPTITKGQLALDPVNGIIYYLDDSNALVNTTLRWNQSSASTINTEDNVNIDGSVTIDGNLIVNGSQTSIESTAVYVEDPIFTLGGNTAPTSDDNKDRGIEFRWHNGSSAKLGFFGFNDSTGKFTFIPDATNASDVYSGTRGTLDANVPWDNVTDKPGFVSTLTGTANEVEVSASTGAITIGLPATINVNVSGNVSGQVSSISNHSINALSDVTITSPADGDFLRWTGSEWINDAVNLSTDTIGNYVESLVAGTGITLTNNSGEGATPTIAVATNTYEAHGAVASHEADTTNIHGIADTSVLVTLAGTQTLTNKTLTSPTITGVSPTVTLAGDLTGSVALTNLGNGTLTGTISNNSVSSNKLNLLYPNTSAFPNASTHHGSIAHSHADGAMFFAHGGNWIKMISEDDGYVASVTSGNNIVITNDIGVGGLDPVIAVDDDPSFGNVSASSLTISSIEIDPTGAENNQVLKYSQAESKFIPGNASIVANLNDLSDVVISSPSNEQVLRYNSASSQWVNATVSFGGGGGGGEVNLEVDGGNATSVYTSPSVIAPIDRYMVNAKGDLIVGSADNTVIRLATGTNGYFLMANSSTASGLQWTNVLDGGAP